jgi:hypothetical protein
MTPITIADLTSGNVTGNGVFDTLMAANKAHIQAEYDKGRITGADYSTVYLGMVQATLSASVQFLVARDKIALEAELLQKQIDNEVKQGELIDAQICKLKAEYDLTMKTITKTGNEADLLAQKTTTEKAQTLELNVDENSIVGRQKALYKAQTDGFQRDAEQKAAKIMADTWNTRRVTDDGVVADNVNMLNDATVGRAITKMLAGVNA